jgi:hypothetical protein
MLLIVLGVEVCIFASHSVEITQQLAASFSVLDYIHIGNAQRYMRKKWRNLNLIS